MGHCGPEASLEFRVQCVGLSNATHMNSTNVESERYCDYFNTMADVISDTLPKKLIEPDDNMASGDDSAKKGTQLCLIEESYIIKESEIQLRSRYDQFISSKYVAVSRL